MAKQETPDTIIEMLKRFGQTLPIPNLDVERIIAHHRSNLEALEQSARAGTEGASALLNRQREMLEETIAQATDTARKFKLPNSPQELVSGQVDLARRAFEQTVANASELSALAQTSGAASVDILRQRIKTAMTELQEGFTKKPD